MSIEFYKFTIIISTETDILNTGLNYPRNLEACRNAFHLHCILSLTSFRTSAIYILELAHKIWT